MPYRAVSRDLAIREDAFLSDQHPNRASPAPADGGRGNRQSGDKEHKGRGYELSKGRYVEIDEDELQAIEIESTHTVDIDSFVPLAEIDKRYLYKPYYITSCRTARWPPKPSL
jgi:hypothetical protein